MILFVSFYVFSAIILLSLGFCGDKAQKRKIRNDPAFYFITFVPIINMAVAGALIIGLVYMVFIYISNRKGE